MKAMMPLFLLLSACTSKAPARDPAPQAEPVPADLSEAERLLHQARAQAASGDKRILVHVGSPG